MSWLDITLMCLAGIGFVKGLFDGIVKQAISLIALVLGIIFCSKGAKWLYQYLSTFDYFSENITMLICYIAAFLLIAGIVLLAGEIASKIIGATPLSIINHLTGGFFGLSVMVIFLSLVLNIADANGFLYELSIPTLLTSYKNPGSFFRLCKTLTTY